MNILSALGFARALARQPDAHKGQAGRVLLIGGAPSMAGALLLAGQGALYGGAGYCLLMMLDPSSAHVLQSQPELMVHDAALWEPAHAIDTLRPDVLAIGPGLGRSAQALHWLCAALAWNGPLVIDADAINLLADNARLLDALKLRQHPTTLTPHPGEAGRLLACDAARVQADRPEAIQRLVAAWAMTSPVSGRAVRRSGGLRPLHPAPAATSMCLTSPAPRWRARARGVGRRWGFCGSTIRTFWNSWVLNARLGVGTISTCL